MVLSVTSAVNSTATDACDPQRCHRTLNYYQSRVRCTPSQFYPKADLARRGFGARPVSSSLDPPPGSWKPNRPSPEPFPCSISTINSMAKASGDTLCHRLGSRLQQTTPAEMNHPSLPLELLQHIATCIDTAHRPSLYAFGFTCKTFHSVSALFIFRQITITVRSREGLQSATKRILEALLRTDSARHVQRLYLRGALQLSTGKSRRDDQDTNCLTFCGLGEVLVDEELLDYLRPYVVDDEPVIKRNSEEDIAWAPVIGLLQAIPNLKDLVCDCQNQFPPGFLSALYEKHPQYRLHHLTFRFRTLLWGIPYAYGMDLPRLHVCTR